MKRLTLLSILLPALSFFGINSAQAFTANMNAGTRSVYLRVGDGAYSGLGNANGTPQNYSLVNLVSVSVPGAQVGNNVDQVMTTNATQTTSYWDGYAFCNVPAQIYIGGFYRRPILGGGASSATLTVTSPANLIDSDGDIIPFTEINWSSSGNGDGTATQPVPSGTFTGGTQTLGTFAVNTWRESCHTFSYANSDFVASGTYTGRVVYTLTVP